GKSKNRKRTGLSQSLPLIDRVSSPAAYGLWLSVWAVVVGDGRAEQGVDEGKKGQDAAISMSITTCPASHECLQSTKDAKELCINEEQGGKKEERAEKRVAECTADFATAEVCVEGEQIKEVFVDGFPDESWDMSRSDSRYGCTDDEEHPSCEKLVEEVVIFESNCKEFREISCLDVSSEKYQLQDTPVDCFAQDIGNREFSTSCDTANIFHPQSIEEFMESRMEVSANVSNEVFELTDKHETRTIVTTSSDNSAYDGSQDEEKKELEQEKYLKYRADLTHDVFGNKLPEDIFEEQHDEQKMVTDHISAISDDTNDLNDENETVGLPFDSVCESKYSTVTTSNASFHHTSPYEDDGHEEEVSENDREKATDTTSLVSDFAENHQAEISVASNIDNTPTAQENSVDERTEDEDENSCTPEGAHPFDCRLICMDISKADQGNGLVY
ncbi:hypothetical protein EJB05_34622, partial [Eragrostis curvula]